MRFAPRQHWAPGLLIVAGLMACSRTNDLPKTPLGQVTAGQPAAAEQSTVPPAVRAALDRGNAEFRAAKYDAALTSYREAARAAPGDPAPYFGIYMAAQKLGKTALADSASKLIQVLSDRGSGLSDSSMRKMHSGETAPKR